MAEVGAEVGLARAAVAAVAVVAVAAEVAVEKVKVEVEKVAEAAGAPGAARSRHSRCPACSLVRVEQSCVARSRCNLCPERRMSTPNQGHRRHRRRCWWSNSSCRNSYTMSSRSSIVSMSHSCNNR